jgi:nucleoside-diphosphate-sugar epimerase
VDEYGTEKAWAEESLLHLAEKAAVPATSLRIAAPYGPGQRTRTVLPIFVEQALRGGPVRYHGSGRRTQTFVHETDVARAFLAALAAPVGFGVLNVAGAEAVAMRALAVMVAEEAHLGAAAAQPSGASDPEERVRVVLSVRLARERLGWEPAVALRDGVATLLAARRIGDERRRP